MVSRPHNVQPMIGNRLEILTGTLSPESSKWILKEIPLETMGFTSKIKGFSAYCPVNKVWDYCKPCQPSLLTLPILNGCRHPE